jgi:hypothetical protein
MHDRNRAPGEADHRSHGDDPSGPDVHTATVPAAVRNTSDIDDLTALRTPLLDLHRQLLEAERVDLERYGGRLTGAEFLQIASGSFRLAWLRPLSELIVAIDETLEAKDEEETGPPEALVARVRELVAPPDEGTPFGRRYLTMLQVSPAVVMAHSALVGALPPRPSG